MDEAADQPSGAGIELAPGVSVPDDALRLQFARAGGPGGQHVNKLNTKAELWIQVARVAGMTDPAKSRLRALAGRRLTQLDEIHLSCESRRSQEQNRQGVFDRLRDMILRALIEPKVRRRTRPSKAAKRRRLEQKRHRGQIKSGRGAHRGGED